MRFLVTFLLFALPLSAFAFIGGGGGTSGTALFANEAFHAETVDNALGTNVNVQGLGVFTVGSFFDGTAVFENAGSQTTITPLVANANLGESDIMVLTGIGQAGNSGAMVVDTTGNVTVGNGNTGSIALAGPGGIADDGGGGVTTTGTVTGNALSTGLWSSDANGNSTQAGTMFVRYNATIADIIGKGLNVSTNGFGHLAGLTWGNNIVTNNGSQYAANYFGNGFGLTTLDASKVSVNTLPSSVIPANVVTNGTASGYDLNGCFNWQITTNTAAIIGINPAFEWIFSNNIPGTNYLNFPVAFVGYENNGLGGANGDLLTVGTNVFWKNPGSLYNCGGWAAWDLSVCSLTSGGDGRVFIIRPKSWGIDTNSGISLGGETLLETRNGFRNPQEQTGYFDWLEADGYDGCVAIGELHTYFSGSDAPGAHFPATVTIVPSNAGIKPEFALLAQPSLAISNCPGSIQYVNGTLYTTDNQTNLHTLITSNGLPGIRISYEWNAAAVALPTALSYFAIGANISAGVSNRSEIPIRFTGTLSNVWLMLNFPTANNVGVGTNPAVWFYTNAPNSPMVAAGNAPVMVFSGGAAPVIVTNSSAWSLAVTAGEMLGLGISNNTASSTPTVYQSGGFDEIISHP